MSLVLNTATQVGNPGRHQLTYGYCVSAMLATDQCQSLSSARACRQARGRLGHTEGSAD